MRTRMLLSVVALLSVAPARAETDHAALTAQLRPEVAATWRIDFDPKRLAWVASSPVHALEHKQGCVIHRQAYPLMDGKPSLARMESDHLYFADAAADACAAIAPERFFAMEPGTEPYGALDFIRRVHRGPADRDRVASADAPRLAACFAPAARPTPGVETVRSQPAADTPDFIYTAVLACPGLRPEERIFATGRNVGEITWDIRASVPIDVGDR